MAHNLYPAIKYTVLLLLATAAFSFKGIAQCDPPDSIDVGSITTSTAVATWPAKTGATGYLVSIGPTPHTPSTTGATFTVNTSHIISGMSSGTNYTICVRTDCGSSGVSTWTCDTFSTVPVVCNAPDTLTVDAATSHSGLASWNAISNAIGYEFYVAPSPSMPPSTAIGTTNTTVNLSSLHSLTTYDFCVRTKCSNGVTSAWSCDTFTTPLDLGVSAISGTDPTITVYPNPATDKITIELSEQDIEGELMLINMYGATVYKTNIRGKLSVDISTQANGIYLLQYRNSTGTKTVRLNKI